MRRSTAAVIPVLALLAACGGPSGRPRTIALGAEACAYCHMTIETDARAAQLVPARGATQVFDEPGCLLRHVAALPVLPDADRLWVRDGASGEWIDARTAVYAVPDRPREGMMYGVIAYRDAAVAARLAPGDRLADFASLLAELRS